MDHPYRFWADLLSKFQGATPWIQALWLVLAAAVAMGVVWCVADLLKFIFIARHRSDSQTWIVYSELEDAERQRLTYGNGALTRVGGRLDDPQSFNCQERELGLGPPVQQ
jgi:hypothetical protein